MSEFEAWLRESEAKIRAIKGESADNPDERPLGAETEQEPSTLNAPPIKRLRGRPRKVQAEEQRAEVNLTPPPTTKPAALRVHIWPSFGEVDKGDGGIRRVVEAQLKFLPKYGIEVVERAENADVIAFHAECPPAYVKRFPEKTFVAMCHGMYWSEYEWDKWSIKANEKVIEGIRVADQVVTCSDWVANSIRRHTSRRVSVIPHGVEAESWSYSPEDNLGYVLWNKTRPDPVCDPEPVNQTAALLPNVQFISTFGKETANVKLTGKLPFDQSKRLLERAGVYLCTTRETFGIGTLEALACGIPIVGYNFGGQHEFIEHRKDGWLVQPGNVQELAEGVRWCLEHRDELVENCRQKALAFTWDEACRRYAEVFKEAHARNVRKTPRTSIVVTNFNLHRYLDDCIRSVVNQNDTDWECIIVDDASTEPDSWKECERIAALDSRIRIHRNPKNVYLAEARNVGIRMARGRYILPLDADDMLAANTTRMLGDALDGDKSIHIAYGGVFFVDEDGKTPTDFKDYFGVATPPGRSQWPFPFVFEQQIQQRNYLPYCSMFRREAWEQTGGYRRRQRTAEDAEFWTRLSSYGFRPAMVTTEDTLIYRNRLGSMSREQGDVDWVQWFSWAKVPGYAPAGAVTKEQLPIPSYDPIVISVIIPVGPGHEKLVQDAIDSVDAQSFKLWECIVVNDSGKPLDELPPWVKVLKTAGKKGPAHARNLGIRESKGRLFLPLDADDFLEPDALQFMHEAWKKTGDVVYSDFWQTDPSGKNITKHECDDYDPMLVNGRKRVVNGITREGMIHSVTALTPKAHWEKVGGYDEGLPGWEDWDFQLALADIGVCEVRVPYPLFTYRKHTGLRREENFASFEQSKAGILGKWKKLWEGGQQLMACGACGSRRSVQPTNSMLSLNARRVSQNAEAVMVRYNGPKIGAVGYRGKSKTMYYFGKDQVRFVLKDDLPMFLSLPDFEVVTPDDEVISVEKEPVLTADRG